MWARGSHSLDLWDDAKGHRNGPNKVRIMWKLLGCLIGFTLVSGVLTADGDVVLSGTIMLTGGTTCVQADGNSVAADNCVKVVVVETATAGEYLIQTLDGTRADNGWTFALAAVNSFTTGGGSTVVFFDGANNLLTVDDITDADTPFIIRLSTEVGTVCLKADGTYLTDGVACADADRFYFAVEDCSVDYCTTCHVDALVAECATCTAGATGDGTDTCTCGDNTIANSGAGTCDACTTLHAECTACNDVCTACSGDYVPDATDGCAMCGDDETLKSDRTECLTHSCTTTDCQYCDVAATCTQCVADYVLADNTCTACGDTEIVVDNTCAACTALHAECTACNDDAGAVCTACNTGYVTDDTDGCKTCDDDETPSMDGSECLEHTCAVADCQYCDVAATCDECMAGYSMADNACTACEDDQILASNVCTDCGDDETPNTDRDACVASCDDNCKFCDDADTCGVCTDGYSVSEGACTEDPEEENSSAQTVPYLSLLSTAVLLGVMIAK